MSDWATRTLIRDGHVVSQTVRCVRLRVRHDGDEKVMELRAPRIRVGSRPGLELTLDDDTVSRTHFELIAGVDGFRLRDLGSRNGTTVDGYRARDIDLKKGSVIRVGRTEIVFEPTDEEASVPLYESNRFGEAVGASARMREIFALVSKAAPTSVTVLLQGESGTGKEAMARSIHLASERCERPFVVVDCSALPANLLESELFGHEKGAFTGAITRRLGLMEEAQGGTLFFDEIGELPLDMQPKLLRALESRSVRRVGGRDTIELDVRVIAATNRDLAVEVNRGSFREDLYYRIAVLEVTLPPLRERPEDVPLLVAEFVRDALREDPGQAERLLASITRENWDKLCARPWPGNVRELRNVIEVSLALKGSEPHLELHAPSTGGASDVVDLDRPYSEHKQAWIERFEKAYVLRQLERHDGNISQAARASGLERMHFKRILKKHT